jgi:signal transduction histidine kinase
MDAPPQDDATAWMTKLARVMDRVTVDADRQGVLAALAGGLVDEFDAALARIWLYDPRDNAMHVRITAGDVRDLSGSSERIPLTGDLWPIARALLNREVVVVEEIGPDSGIRDLAWAQRQGFRSFAGFPLVLGDRLIGAMVVYRRTPLRPEVRDALRLLAYQAALALEHARVIDESHSLQEVAAELASSRDTDALAEAIVRRTAAALGADASAIWLVDDRGGGLRPTAVHGLSDRFVETVVRAGQRTVALAFAGLQRDRLPLFSPDAVAEVRARDPELADALAAEGVRSLLRLPLFGPGDETVGMLVLYHRNERPYGTSEVRFAQTFAHQIAVALENARLAEHERLAREAAARQIERLAAINQITEQLLAATEQDTVLRVVAEAAARLSPGMTGMIALVEAGGDRLALAAAHGPLATVLQRTFPAVDLTGAYRSTTAMGRALTSGQTIVVEDDAARPAVSDVRGCSLEAGIRAFIAAPLRVGPRVIGLLWAGDTNPRSFAPEDVLLVEALADHAALAIEHVRLALRGQEAAVLEERARLARDLHDSVTQSLFSVSMLTSAAQTQHARRSPALASTLARAGHLAQEALAEMRALLYELRPEALTAEGLTIALDKLVRAVRVRTDVPIGYTADCDRRLPPDVETAIFRIVQESLGNAVKHARATAIAVTLSQHDGELRVTVQDNGTGFDPAAPSPAHGRQGGLGLRSMRERAAAAGLTLDVSSTVGSGTTVTVCTPAV